MPAEQLDLSGLLKGQVSVTPEEHEAVRTARLKLEARAALIDDCKGVAAFTVLLLGVIAIAALTAYEGIFDAAASPDTKRWSQTILSSLMTGAISFVIGRKVGK